MEKFYKKSTLTSIALLMMFTSVFSQTTISGLVRDGSTNEPLAGVNILVKGRVIGTISNSDGQFNLKVNQEPPLTLVFSFIGFRNQEIEITSATPPTLKLHWKNNPCLDKTLLYRHPAWRKALWSP
ncbi:carboxypeptidase-like regulatory domain-containing protein [Oscillatoria amoena NRMC-F 0135]|nr:carboxypeptidase-like regulatory domain-containing protein [Oscillatoria amoena NRMC-F 0135]